MKSYAAHLLTCFRNLLSGSVAYYIWVAGLFAMMLIGLNAYCKQLVHGLSVTGMSDQVAWSVYIANFTFLDGVAAASVLSAILSHVYKDGHVRKLVVFGHLLAVSAAVTCLLFIFVDLGRPERGLHMVPGFGEFNWPNSILTWDTIVFCGYIALNAHLAGYLLYMEHLRLPPKRAVYVPCAFINIVWAFGLQAVAAFLYIGLGARPFWNTAIIAPHFLAAAFVAGPAILLLTMQAVRHLSKLEVANAALFKLRSVIQVAMLINLFLLLSESFAEFYTGGTRNLSAHYLYFGIGEYNALVPWIWSAVGLNLIATALLVSPLSRRLRWLNVACVMAIVGIWIEKGMGVIIPAFIPTPLGEIVEYAPTLNETLICFGIWAFGALFYTLLIKAALTVLTQSPSPDSALHAGP